jgi:serine/threonine-protein kinase
MGHPVDARSDLFSAGILLYQLITGESPFPGQSIATIMYKIVHDEPVEPSKLNIRIPTVFDKIIKKALAKRPDDRFQNADEFFKSVQRAIQSDLPTKTGASDKGSAGDDASTVILSSSVVISDKTTAGSRRSVSAILFSGIWQTNEKNVSFTYSVQTDGMTPDTYRWSVSVTDKSDNTKTFTGSFILHSKAKYGYLNLFTKPWAKIYINGEYHGNTPKAGLKLPTGNLKVCFVNESEGIDVTETVTIRPDELTKQNYTWKK